MGPPSGLGLWKLQLVSPRCVIKVLLEKGVQKRLEDGGKAAMKTSVDEDRQKVVDLFKAYGVILDEE